MSSKITIKRKVNVGINKQDKQLLKRESNITYIGFIFIYYYTPKPRNPKKILLNHSYIYLKHHTQFPLVKVNYSITNINNTYVTDYLTNNYNLDNIKLIKKIYEHENLQLYMINLNDKNVLNIQNFNWRTYLDFYTYDLDTTFDDIYYNILYKDNNLHLSHKFYANNHIKIFIKLRKLYDNLIADNIVKHGIIDNVIDKNKIKLKRI